MSKPKVHLLSNAHLDPVWQWEWEEGAAAAVSTFRAAADLCEEFDGYIFNHNEAILYQWVEEYEPALMERIKRLVQAGKWNIMGGWHLQPDCNMPSGESFVRQMLLGRSYFKDRFGVEPTTAINFDPFGHTRGLVQIMAKSGFDSYLFCRPGPDDMTLESDNFVWVGYDGSEVLATRMIPYNSPLGKAREKVEGCLAGIKDQTCIVIPWGVGNHGGGPSRKDIADLNELIRERTDVEIIHSTAEGYFADLCKRKESLPRVERDLNPWGVGCYTSQVRLKQKNRLLENELYSIEKMSAAAAFQGVMDYPAEDLHQAMLDLATCQFHDILPGSSVQAVEETSLRLFDHGLEILSRIKARAFFALASGQPKAADGEFPILVYNPHPFKVTVPVECEFMLADQNWAETWTVTPVYKDGAPVPYQNIKEDGNISLDWRKRVVFLAELEPSRMNRFDCRTESLPEKPQPIQDASGEAIAFDNGRMQVTINTKTGLIDRYTVDGVDYLKENAFQPLVIEDNEDPWGMTTHSYRNVAGKFTLMSPEAGTRFSGVTVGTLPSVRIVEDGPVWTVVEAVFGYENSAVCQQYMLPKAGTEIEVRVRVQWMEKNRMLKLSIPTVGQKGKYIGQVAYGYNELPSNGDEAVSQKWAAVVSEDGKQAVTVINDGIYASDFSEDGLRLTLLRSPAYAGHPIFDRPIVVQDRFTPRIDQGERLYRFWINAGPAEERFEKIDRESLVRNEKPYALSFFPYGGGKRVESFVTLSDYTVQVAAIKQAQDGSSLIVRLFEPTGKARKTVLSLPFAGIETEVSMGAFEIKTLKVDPAAKTVVETDLMER